MNFSSATKSFWVIVSEQRGMTQYPYKHENESEAFREAERLASQNGGRFYVFEAKGYIARCELIRKRFSEDQEIPF